MCLAVILVAGCLLRLDGIGVKSMSHPEMWAPLIPLKADIADPPARNSLLEVLDYTLGKDTHPPGFYVFLWAWMKLFGYSEWAIRLPSVFFGVASIGIVYWLGALMGRRGAGLIGAALLAFNGYHIDWSGIGRMYAGATFFALLSTALLLRLTGRPADTRRWPGVLFFLAVLGGVSFHVLVWPVIVAQMMWVLWNARTQKRGLPEVWNIQVAAFLAGSPLLTFAIYQSHHPVATLSREFWLYAREIVQFGFLIPARGICDLQSSPPPAIWSTAWGPTVSLLRILLLIGSIAILLLGMRSLRRLTADVPAALGRSGWRALWIPAALLALTISAGFLWIVHRKAVPLSGTIVAALLPIPLCLLALFLPRFWNYIPGSRSGRSLPLFPMLAAGPFVLLMAVNLARPIFGSRELLMLVPFFLAALAFGIERLFSKRLVAVAVCALLVYLHVESIRSYRRMIIGSDFHAWSDKVKPYLQESDLIFVIPSWYGTPLLYYIRPPQYHVFGRDFRAQAERHPGVRIWWFSSRPETMPEAMRTGLAGYHEVMKVTSGRMVSTLYAHD